MKTHFYIFSLNLYKYQNIKIKIIIKYFFLNNQIKIINNNKK